MRSASHPHRSPLSPARPGRLVPALPPSRQLQQQKGDLADLAPDLVGELIRFQSASDINLVLSKLLLLLSQDRISPRRAAVLAYINHLLLRTLPAIEQELHPKSDRHAAPPTIVFDIPRPRRDLPPQAP